MIPILFEKTETAFTSNGLCRLRDALTVEVTEERNGIYECDFTYPIDGANFEHIIPGRIIGVTHDETESIQPFDIVSYTRPIDGIVTFHAVHVSYRQTGITVTGSNINSLADAFTLLASGEPSNPFTYWTDKTSTGYLAAADGLPKSVRSILGGVEGSILDAYGGEYEFDNFTVKLWTARGQERDFAIRYGVNMLDYNEDLDISGTYSSCVPYWTDGTNSVIGDRVDSGATTTTGRGECVPLDVSDKFENKPTKAQVEAMGLSMMATKQSYSPGQTINVSFVRLQDLGEYAAFQDLLQCSLCDTINVIFAGTKSKFKIVKTVWDVLRGKYKEMELGQLSTTLSEALGLSGSERAGSTSEFLTASKSLSDSSERVTLSSGTTAKTVLSLTAPISGHVYVTGYIQITNDSTNSRHAEISVGGVTYDQATFRAAVNASTFVSVSAVAPVSEGETITIDAWQNSGSTLYAGGQINALFVS